jgi:hypothetical protein
VPLFSSSYIGLKAHLPQWNFILPSLIASAKIIFPNRFTCLDARGINRYILGIYNSTHNKQL